MRSLAEIIISMPAVGQQHQHRVLELRRLGLAHVVEGQEQRAGAGHEREHLHEAAEAVDHEAAVEQRLPCRPAARGRATPPEPGRRWRASRSPRPRGRSRAGTRPASAAPWRRSTSTISGSDQARRCDSSFIARLVHRACGAARIAVAGAGPTAGLPPPLWRDAPTRLVAGDELLHRHRRHVEQRRRDRSRTGWSAPPAGANTSTSR